MVDPITMFKGRWPVHVRNPRGRDRSLRDCACSIYQVTVYDSINSTDFMGQIQS